MPVPQNSSGVKTTPAATVSTISEKSKVEKLKAEEVKVSSDNSDNKIGLSPNQTRTASIDNHVSSQERTINEESGPNTAYIANIATAQDSSPSNRTTKNTNVRQNSTKTINNSGNQSSSVATNKLDDNSSSDNLDDILAANGLISEANSTNIKSPANTQLKPPPTSTNNNNKPGNKPSATDRKTTQATISTSKRNDKNDELRIQIALAKRYYDAGKFQNAIDLLESPSVNPGADASFKDLLLLSYMKYAGQLVTKAELLEAQTILEKAIDIEPNNKELKVQLDRIKNKRESDRLYRTGLDALNLGDEDKAFKAFQQVLEFYPDHKLARQHMVKIKGNLIEERYKEGMQYYRKQELSEAIKAWDDVLVLDPNHELSKLYRSRAVELKRKLDTIDNL